MSSRRPRLSAEATPVRKRGFRVAGFSGVIGETTRDQIPTFWPRLTQRLPLQGQIDDAGSFGVFLHTDRQRGGLFPATSPPS